MKLISFVVPSYNSEGYLERCLDTLVAGGRDVEVIVVNDGSTDGTETIALGYKERYPEMFQVVSKENGGHGSAINEGLKHANGLFFKVVDSDDWLDTEALARLLARLKEHLDKGQLADLYICNFIYDKISENSFFVRKFNRKFRPDVMMTWKDVRPFFGAQVLLMHSLIYNTEKLRQSKIRLPHHTFYVDNLFAYQPLPFMEKIYYMDIDLYHYFIGREDQSVNIKVFSNRYDQQIRVMTEMVNAYPFSQISLFQKGLRNYMLHCLGAIMIVTILFTVAKDGPGRKELLQDLWDGIKSRDIKLYRHLRRSTSWFLLRRLPWHTQGWIMVNGYKLIRKRLKLG